MIPSQSLAYRTHGHFTNGLHSGAGALTSDRKALTGRRDLPPRVPVQAWENEGGHLGAVRSGGR